MSLKAKQDIRRKKQVLEHAARIRNIRKTCRSFGIPRSSYYVWKAAYEREGDAGMLRTERLAQLAIVPHLWLHICGFGMYSRILILQRQ